MKYALTFTVLLSLCISSSQAQALLSYSTAQAHSHNDSRQLRPFQEAYNQQFGSVETDVILKDGVLYAVNHAVDATPDRTLTKLYLQPVSEQIDKNNGQIYLQRDAQLQLVLDLQSPAGEALPVLLKELENFKNLTEPDGTVKIIISGNLPSPELFTQYPAYIRFEGTLDVAYTPEQSEYVALIGQSFQKYTRWNGEGPLSKNDQKSISKVVQKAHELGKKIRFRDTPDNINTWKTMMSLQVDYLDTGKVIQMGDYLRTAPR